MSTLAHNIRCYIVVGDGKFQGMGMNNEMSPMNRR